MKVLHSRRTLAHNEGAEIEGPYRISQIEQTVSNETINRLRSRTMEALHAIHKPEYVESLHKACKARSEIADANLTPSSFDAMLVSVSLALLAADENAFAVTRPPGHHALTDHADGFCFFNNIAVAAQELLREKKRVCIVDIDGHHGNGTQAIFKDKRDVLFCSMHQSGVYPWSGSAEESSVTEDGSGLINIPLPMNSGDDIAEKVVLYLINRISAFRPSFIAVSAGFDGHFKDKLLKLKFSESAFYTVGSLLSSLDCPTFAVLEGGYHADIPDCIDSFVRGITHQLKYHRSNTASSKEVHDEVEKTLDIVTSRLRS